MSLLTSLGAAAQPAAEPRARLRLRRFGLTAALLSAGPALLLLFKLRPSSDWRFESAAAHFGVVTTAAVIAVGLALVMLRAAQVRRDGRLLLLGGGFLGMSAVFLIHAIATPGVLFGRTLLAVQLSTPLALTVGAVLVGLSASERVGQVRWLLGGWRLWLALGAAAWLLYAGFVLIYVPRYDARLALAHAGHGADGAALAAPGLQASLLGLMSRVSGPLYGAVILAYGLTALLYLRRWREMPTRPLAALCCSVVLLGETAAAAYLGGTWHASFWMYHVLLVAAVGCATYGVVGGYQQGGGLSGAISGLLLRSTLQRQQSAVRGAMQLLLSALGDGNVEQALLLRGELRQRFALADDQLDLVEHAVQVVAQERAQANRLRALTDIGRAATLDLDPDALVRDAVAIFGAATDAGLCAIGLVDGPTVRFKADHCFGCASDAGLALGVPVSDIGRAMTAGGLRIAPLPAALAALGDAEQHTLQMPLQHHGQTLGLLLVRPQAGTTIDERLIDVCRSISSQLATALANADLFRELQRKHESVLQSEQMREQLTQMVVHDLKNPLTAMRGFVALLGMTPLTPDQLELVRGADRSSSTMLQLVSDILDIARLQEGRLDLHAEPTDIAELMGECLAQLQLWADQGGKPVTVAVADDMPPLALDRRLMTRVITNLLSNALKHTISGTAITLGAAVDAAGARLWVHDTGSGIAPDVAQRLFERFSATDSVDGPQSNTGLGLTFCKLAVEAHGGVIAVDSTPGAGTTFTIVLPLERLAGA